MTKRICLVTTGQPSTDPRLVKEADALAAAGHEVHVIGAHWADWADRADVGLIERRQWSCRVIDWRRRTSPWLFWKSRLRHQAARVGSRATPGPFASLAASRLTPELTVESLAWPADLYIAHNLGALPAASAAAVRYGAKLGFDAEDYHRGQLPPDEAAAIAPIKYLEDRYIPQCDYVTAASPGIAAAYAELSKTPPTVVLNVFPTSDRPAARMPRQHGPLRLYWFSQTIGRTRGLENIVSAMGRLPGRAIELHLRGVWQAGFERELQAVAEAASVDWNRVISHEPAAPDAMVRAAADFDAGLALELGETTNADLALSNKIFTYLLAGIPVLASNTTAQAALARECGSTGAMIVAADVDDLAAALKRWIDEPDVLAAGRLAAWQLGTTRYNWEIEREAFLAVVRGVFGEADPRDRHVRGLAS